LECFLIIILLLICNIYMYKNISINMTRTRLLTLIKFTHFRVKLNSYCIIVLILYILFSKEENTLSKPLRFAMILVRYNTSTCEISCFDATNFIFDTIATRMQERLMFKRVIIFLTFFTTVFIVFDVSNRKRFNTCLTY